MEEVINSIQRASSLVQNLEQDLSNLVNHPGMLSLSIDEITEAFTAAKDRLLLISRQNQTPESPPTLLHETAPLEPQMDATVMQEWLRSSHQLFQMQQLHAARSTLQIGEMGGGREVEDSERTMGSEGDQVQGIHASSSRPRRRSREGNQEKKKILVPAPRFGNTELPPDDCFTWRKYGQKEILGSKYPRSYYRCTHQKLYECQAKKLVQRLDHNPNIFEVTYRGNHTCHMSSTAPSSVPPQQLLLDMTQNSNTISVQLSPTTNLSLNPGVGGGASTSRYGGDCPVVDMADAMFNSGSSSGNNSMEFLFSPTEDRSDAN